MAEKKSWRDYLKEYQSNVKLQSDKDDEENSGGWREYANQYANEIASNQVGKMVSEWLKQHNSYVSSHQGRFLGRTGTYTDSYVGDSSQWLESATAGKSSLDESAKAILSYLSQYGGYLDPKVVGEVKSAIENGQKAQSQIYDIAQKDYDYWNSFGSDAELVDKYGSAQGVYEYYQRGEGYRNKYQGLSSEDLQWAAGFLDDGEEKEWLNSYAGSVAYQEKSQYDVTAGEAEIAAMEQELVDLQNYYAECQNILLQYVGTNQYDAKAAELYKNYGGTAQGLEDYFYKKQQEIEDKKKYLQESKDIQVYTSGYQGYMSNLDAQDYANNSQYESTWTGVDPESASYVVSYSNGMTPDGSGFSTRYDTEEIFGDILYDYINGNSTAVSVMEANNAYSIFGFDKEFLTTMTEEEVGVYNYLYKTQGKKAAEEFLHFIEKDLQGRKAMQEQQHWAKKAEEDPFGTSVFSTLISPYKGLGYIGQTIDMIANGEVNEYGNYNRYSNISTAIRSKVASIIENSGKWGKVGSFAYNTGMSMADFLYTTAVSGGNQALSLAIMGTGAAADSVIAAKQRGLDDTQAFTLGTIAGLAEIAMEKISLGAWLDGDMTEGALRYVLKNALSEGGEEAGTSIINLIADIMIAGDKSEWKMAIQKYMAEGKTEEEAFGLVLAENAAQIGLDALGGILSGAAIGGGTYAIKGTTANIKYGGIKNNSSASEDIISKGIELNPDNQFMQNMKNKIKSGKKLTGIQTEAVLQLTNEQITFKNIKEIAKARLSELGQTEDVSKIAELVTKFVTGQELGKTEKSVLARSQFGSQVAKEINTAMLEAESTTIDEKSEPIEYKPLEERAEAKYVLDKEGKTTLNGEEIDLSKATVANVGKNGMTLRIDGKEVSIDDIKFADSSQGFLYYAVSQIENISPGAATEFIRGYDKSSGLTVGEYLNGIDEAYTYGYWGYSEADLKAGLFTGNLTKQQLNDAYNLGQYVRKNEVKVDEANRVKMRTEADAKMSKEAKAAQQKSRIESDDVDVYFMDGKSMEKFGDLTGYNEKRMAAVNTAKFLKKLGIGGKFVFYESYEKNGKRYYKDKNGKEVEAPNGFYDPADGSIYIDLNAGNDGSGKALFTMGHELAHFIKHRSEKQFKILADLVTEAFDKTDVSMRERVLAKQKFLEDVRGKKVSYSEAYEEVVADAMSTMLTDGSFYNMLMEIKVKDKGLFATIKRFFTDMIAKFKEAYAGLTPDQRDAQDIRELKDCFDKIQRVFAEGLVEASENFQAEQELAQAGIAVNSKTESGSLLSVRDVLSETDRQKVAKALAERFGVTLKEATEWLKAETSLASLILNPKYSAFLDYEADPNEVAIKQNSDYPQGTVDFSNICKKRREFTQVMNRVLRNFPNHVFAATDLAKIRTIMGEEGMTLPCGICYVEDRRQLDSIVAQDFIDSLKLYREGSKTRPDGKPFNANQIKGLQLTDGDTYVPTIYELVTLEGRNSLKEKNPNMEAAWVRFNNARGMQAVRLLTNEAEYKRQILKYSKKTVQTKNDYGGLRIYSFSDAEMFHLIDIIQVLTDCATVGLKVQGYTKVNEYAKAVKDTGEKLNRSLIPLGDLGYHIENGKVVLDFDTVEGIDINSEDFFDSKDNPDVGNIVIGINLTQIRAAMVSDFIDYIIPFHTGQSAEVLGEKGIAAWNNYEKSQSEVDLATGKKSAHQINIYTEVFQAAENEGKPIQNKRDFVEKFLSVCKENGLRPRFAEFLNTDANGDYVYTEGYHKFLVDFKTFAQTEVGEYLPQMPVKPIFDNGYITGLLETYVEEQKVKDAEVAKQMPKVIERITNEIIKPNEGVKNSDRDDGIREGLDTSQKATYYKEKTVEQEVKGNERRKETREAFIRRASETLPEVEQRGEIAFGFKRFSGQQLQNIRKAEEGLKRLGIPVVVFEQLEGNKDGFTTIFRSDGVAIPGVAVFIHHNTTAYALEIVGHEGYHYLATSGNRVAYNEVLAENIDFASKAFIDYQQKYVDDNYFAEDVEIGSKEWTVLMEEIFAYVTGHIHAGDPKGEVHKFIRDYDAVKGAWDDLLKKQTAGKKFSERGTTATEEVPYQTVLGNLSEYSREDLVSISDQISDGTFTIAHSMSKDSLIIVLRETLSIVGKDDPTLTFKIPVSKVEQVGDESVDTWTPEDDNSPFPLENTVKVVKPNYLPTNAEIKSDFEDMLLFLHNTFGHKYTTLEELAKEEGVDRVVEEMLTDWGTEYGGTPIHKMIDSIESKTKDELGENYDVYGDEVLFNSLKAIVEDVLVNPTGGQKNRYSDRDSTGKQLTKEQQEFFKDSVVRDADGNLLPVYHSTSEEFDTFEVSDKSITGEFYYFAVSKTWSKKFHQEERYSDPKHVKKCYLNLTNVFDLRVEPNYTVYGAGGYYGNEWIKYIEDKGVDLDSRFKEMWSAPQKNKHYAFGGIPAWLLIRYDGFTGFRESLIAAGYDGIVMYDVARGRLDNTVYVAFHQNQIKLASNKKPTTDPNTRFSERGEDSSNRSLLANAFEGITKSSPEYKYVQRYKGYIAELNSLENKLSEINREIRDIRFKKGQYDAEKLKRLEAEKKTIEDAIVKYDKMLLSLEASAPLRRVIENERKKAAKKAKEEAKEAQQSQKDRFEKKFKEYKEHVGEVQQGKKERSEKTELRKKIRKVIRDLDKLLNRGGKDKNVKKDMKGFVSKALQSAEILFTDNYNTYDMLRNGIGTDLSDAEEALVKSCTDMLKDLDAMPTDGYDNWQAYQVAERRLKAKMSKLNEVFARESKRLNNTAVSSILGELADAYASLADSDKSYVKGAYNEPVHNYLKHIQEKVGGTIIKDMTKDQLESVYKAYQMVLHSVRTANKLFVNDQNETIDDLATQLALDFGSRKIPEKTVALAMQKLTNKLGWDYEKLYYALDRIGSETFTKLIMNIANSENIVMQDVIEAVEFRDEIVEKYGYNNWAINKKIDREFMDNTGKKFTMTLGQLMSLYAYSRREGAWDHIEYGGFVFGEKALTNPKPADSYKLSKEQCEAITSLLTNEQKAYVEAMQKYLSEVMGAKGNEVSTLLYGIDMFGEKNYFPIHVAGQYQANANESNTKAAEGFQSMSNAGFTHAQNPNAKAPFVLEGFNEIWVDHVNEMSRYHGTVPALEDLRRVMNRSTYFESTEASASIKAIMENHFGEEAVKYFDNLYREANSGAIRDKLEKRQRWLLSMFRKNSVAYSLSVLIQQPAAMVRAYAMIDKKYFGYKGFGTLTAGIVKAVSDKWTKAHTNSYNEMLKYAPGVTMAKEIGGFDTATGGSIRSYLLDTHKSIKQKWKTGNAKEKGKAILDIVDDNAIANLPNLADKIAWIEIWNACKRETIAKHKDLAPNSEEFMQIVGDRFTEVIRATQVYDSIFSKSPMLKSKSGMVQYLVSFMNEPNTVANMTEKAVRDFAKGDRKGALLTAAVVVHSIIFTNVLKSIVYAMRDDDEDETYTEKFIEAVVDNLMSDINPLNYVPLARDVVSKLHGFDVERPDMAIITDAIDALNAVIKKVNKDTEGMTEEQIAELDDQITESYWKLAGSIASFFGIPLKNIYRDIAGAFDHARIAYANAGKTTWLSALDKIKETILNANPFAQEQFTKSDKLYGAIVAGDQTYIDRLKAGYVDKHGNFDQSKYDSAVVKALRENDPRIKAAAQAGLNGNTAERSRILQEIKGEIGSDYANQIILAIHAETEDIRNKDKPEKVQGQYGAYDFVEAVYAGDAETAKNVREDIINTYMDNGKTQKEAEIAFKSDVESSTEMAYSYGTITKDAAENMLIDYAGMGKEDAADRITYWDFQNANPDTDLTESKALGYLEYADPAGVSLEIYEQFVEDANDIAPIKDKWGKVEKTERDQIVELIDDLPLTRKQKNAIYLAYGLSESKLWDVPW